MMNKQNYGSNQNYDWANEISRVNANMFLSFWKVNQFENNLIEKNMIENLKNREDETV